MSAPAAHASPALSREAYFAALAKRHGAENQQKLARAQVGIAGLGGLGSSAACHLARLGVGTLVLVDFDVVDVSNLHRQQYTCAQVGMKKTEALAETLRAINPFIELELYSVKVTAENAPTLFAGCPIVCEAFDEPTKGPARRDLVCHLPRYHDRERLRHGGDGVCEHDSHAQSARAPLSLRRWLHRRRNRREPCESAR